MGFFHHSQAQTEKAKMQHDMSAQLYDKMQDSQEGVVSDGPFGVVQNACSLAGLRWQLLDSPIDLLSQGCGV